MFKERMPEQLMKSEFYDLLGPHLISGPYRNEIDAFLEGGEV
jgi:hypothetical protein